LQDEILEYRVQNQKNTGHRKQRTGQQRNWKGTQCNKFRGFTRLYLTIHPFVQQKEICEIARTMGIRSQNKPHKGSTQRTKYKSLCNDIERRRSSQSVAG